MKKVLVNLWRLLMKQIEKNLYVPDVSVVSGVLGAPMQKLDDEAVVLRLQKQRKPFVDAIISNLPTSKMSFCSIAAGYGAEEFLLKDSFKKFVLMEPSSFCFQFLSKIFNNQAELCPELMERAQFNHKFDFIYTSSPTNWMQRHPSQGVPDSFIKFLDENLETNGIFYARIYGGLHINRVVRAAYFYQRLIETLSPKFVIQTAWYNEEFVQARIVVTRREFKETEEFLKFTSALNSTEGSLKVSKNRFIGKKLITPDQILLRVVLLLVYLPLNFVRQVLKISNRLLVDVHTNLRLD